jgi:CRISPR-associated protein Cmr1
MSKTDDFSQKFRERYFKRKRIDLECEVITPMFLGNAVGEAEWRAEPFKALLRWWWRVMQPNASENAKEDFAGLLAKEGAIFGSAGEGDEARSGKSTVVVSLSAKGRPTQEDFPSVQDIDHPEVKGGRVNPLLYLAGIGLMRGRQVNRQYFQPSSRFRLTLDFSETHSDSANRVLSAIQLFGTAGARARNAWGSFRIVEGWLDEKEVVKNLNLATRDWLQGLRRDYPNCLGKDDRPLLWRSPTRSSWPDVMRDLADAYVRLRARKVGVHERLGPDNGQRHLLGIPLSGNHPSPSQTSRYASPLRFAVRKHDDQYFGVALALPQRFPNGMGKMSLDQEKETWEIVHKKLDILLRRASYEECL